ncbi:MAG TPA: hypothetical protein VE079_05805 [Ensifer sp.]|nr:hypothetical protein [Ensifer sp.]
MLLSSSSSRSSREAIAAQRTKTAPALSTSRRVVTEIAAGATGEKPSLRELIDQHSAAVQGGKKAKAKASRLAIINYEPKGDGEAYLKLTYLAGYLIATKGTLSAKEMSSLLADRPVRSTS